MDDNYCTRSQETSVCYICHWSGKCIEYERGYKKPHYPVPAIIYEVWRDEFEPYGLDIVHGGKLVWSMSCQT